jgi:hypothetical protein
MRSTITGGPEGLEIVIPARRHLLALLFLGVWLVGWLVGEMTVISQVFSGRAAGPEVILLLWLIFWTSGGALAASVWLWMLVGKERVLVGASTLHVKRDVLGLGWTRSCELYKVRNLRVAPQPGGPRDMGVALRLSGLAGGMIAFEYGRKTIRFGAGLDEAEAHMIVGRMKQRYAFAETSSAPVEPSRGSAP